MLSRRTFLLRGRSSKPNESEHGEGTKDEVSSVGTVGFPIRTADEILAVIKRRPRCRCLNLRISVLDDTTTMIGRTRHAANDVGDALVL